MKKILLIIIVVVLLAILFYLGTPAPEGSGCVRQMKILDRYCSALSMEECIAKENVSVEGVTLNLERYCEWREDKGICDNPNACQ